MKKNKVFMLICLFVFSLFSILAVLSSPLIPISGSVNGKDQIRITWSNPYGDVTHYPYSYKLMQSSDGGSSYHPISTWIDGEKVKVLNLRPSNAKQSLHEWMEVAGRGMIDITEVYLADYNANPDAYLKDGNGNYKYDVLVFGTSDWNGKEDLSSIAVNATDQFIQAGRGVLFGHDTILRATNKNPWWGTAANHPGFNQLAHYVGINTDYEYNETNKRSDTVRIVKEGLLTSYPNQLSTNTLTIPNTHAFGQYAGDAYGSTIWMTLFDDMRQNSSGGFTDWYLVSKNNTAMIQTGDSDSQYPTLDEEKVFANVIFYLKQITDNTYAVDNTAYDTIAPSNLSVSKVSCPTTDEYKQNLRLSANDQGNSYKYFVEGYPQRDGYGDKTQSNILSIDSASGISGYWYTINNSSNAVSKPNVSTSGWYAPNIESSYEFTTGILDNNKTYYVHFFAKDLKGNISNEQIYTIPKNNSPVISVSKKEFYEGQYTVQDWQKIRNNNVTASDFEDGSITSKVALISDTTKVNMPGTYKLSYKVKDNGCLTVTKDNTVIVKYNNPPRITTVNRSFYENQYTADYWYDDLQMKNITAMDIEDGNLTNKISVISDNVNITHYGDYSVTYKVIDAYGKSDTATSKVTVKYNNPPVILAQDQVFYEDEINILDWQQLRKKIATASDVEDGNLTNKIEIIRDNVNPTIPDDYEIVYKVTDAFGKTNIKTVKVKIKYNNPPKITGVNKRFMENELSKEDWKKERTKEIEATDIEDGLITSKIKVISDNVKLNDPGFYHVTYEVEDKYGKNAQKTIEVEIIHNQIPIILAENKTFYENELTEEKWQEEIMKNVSALDKEDGDITSTIKHQDNVDITTPGIYEVVYTVIDSGGKETSKAIDVMIKPNHQPTLTIFAENKRFIEGEYTIEEWINELRMENVSASDIEDNDLTEKVEIIKDNVDPDKSGVYEVTYKVTDRYGKSKETTIKVTVEANLPPVIHATERWFTTQDKITEKELLKKVIAYDDLDGEMTNKVKIKSNTVNEGKVGDYKVIYSVVDHLGKEGQGEAIIHIIDMDSTPLPPVDPPVPPSDNDAVIFANGKKYGTITLEKIMEHSDVLNGTDYESVVFGVYTDENIYYNQTLILKKNSLVSIIRLDGTNKGSAKVYHQGNYYIKEIAVNNQYKISNQVYRFRFEY